MTPHFDCSGVQEFRVQVLEWNALVVLEGTQEVHLHLIYVHTCEKPLFNGGGDIYLLSLNIFHPIRSYISNGWYILTPYHHL